MDNLYNHGLFVRRDISGTFETLFDHIFYFMGDSYLATTQKSWRGDGIFGFPGVQYEFSPESVFGVPLEPQYVSHEGGGYHFQLLVHLELSSMGGDLLQSYFCRLANHFCNIQLLMNR